MKKIYIIIIILVLIVLGLFVFARKSNSPANLNVADTNTPVIPVSNENTSEAPVREFTVTGQNFSFTPSTMAVKDGDRVKITFKNTEGFHDLKIDEFNVATRQLKAGEEDVVEFIADKTGSFEYYCSVGSHRAMGMKGTLVVE